VVDGARWDRGVPWSIRTLSVAGEAGAAPFVVISLRCAAGLGGGECIEELGMQEGLNLNVPKLRDLSPRMHCAAVGRARRIELGVLRASFVYGFVSL